ncbi:MAG TPA: hypothetical protein VGI16_14830 [Candidatus Acidoferrum sp.]|jgi:uncharacterized protein YbaR (Trm112 family)
MKYCPLCGGEFQDAVECCAKCRAVLVGASDGIANSPKLLWVGKDLREFELVIAALFDAEVPYRAKEAAPGIYGMVSGAESSVHVLAEDFAKALLIADAAIRGRQGSSRACHQCGVASSASMAACPVCRAQLLVDREPETKRGIFGQKLVVKKAKYCPICDAEYPDSGESCTVCGVELVREELRGRPLDERQRDEGIEVAWRGGDPVAVSEAITILREAGIYHHVQATSDHLVFELGMPRPKYVVRVFASDVARAKELLSGIRESLPFSLGATVEDTAETELVASHGETKWKPGAATVEVWQGEDSALAGVLENCLRENRIGVRREGREAAAERLLVMPEDEVEAREIVREVREGTPLE